MINSVYEQKMRHITTARETPATTNTSTTPTTTSITTTATTTATTTTQGCAENRNSVRIRFLKN